MSAARDRPAEADVLAPRAPLASCLALLSLLPLRPLLERPFPFRDFAPSRAELRAGEGDLCERPLERMLDYEQCWEALPRVVLYCV